MTKFTRLHSVMVHTSRNTLFNKKLSLVIRTISKINLLSTIIKPRISANIFQPVGIYARGRGLFNLTGFSI